MRNTCQLLTHISMSNQQAKSYNLSFVLSVSRSISAVCVHPESLSHHEREMSFAGLYSALHLICLSCNDHKPVILSALF